MAVAEQGGVIAQAAELPTGTVWAEWRVGITHHFLGNQAAAQLHLEHGMALAVELDTLSVNFFGLDQRIRALVGLARTLWLRGFSDRALRSCKRLSMKRRAGVTQFRSAFRWFMPRCCYCGVVIY